MSVLLRSRPGVLLVLLVLVVGGLGITSSGAEASPPNAPATPATPAAPAAPVEMTAPSARGNPDRDFASMPRACRSRVEPSKICRVTRFKKRPWIVLWGDSHALQYLSPVTAIARNRRVNLVAIYSGGCPLSLPFPAGSDEPRLACDHHNVRAWEYVRDLASSKRRVRVILGSYWHYYRTAWERLQEEERNGVAPEDSEMTTYERHIARLGVERSPVLFRKIGAAGIRADVLAQSGTVAADAPFCLAGEDPYVCDQAREAALPQPHLNRRWLGERSALLSPRPQVIDTSATYCDSDTCFGRVGSTPTFYDRSHLGERMTRFMREWFRPSVRALLRQ